MEEGRKGYVRVSPHYNVELNRADSYATVISKIGRAAEIEIHNLDEMRLFNGKGAIIPNVPLLIRLSKTVKWTLGAFLAKRHTSPDRLTLGIGCVTTG